MSDAKDVKFTDFPFLDTVFEDLSAAGYERPTPIQAECIPHALAGKDVIGLAQTGTGKTAAFALPIINRLARRLELAGLVLAPTRELAAQTTAFFNQLGASSGIRVATIVGGVPMDKDYLALRSWPNVLVATPGRLIDHIETTKLSLAEIEVLVVDEADRMHDMGFIPQLRRIIAALPRQRQTMMFTATMDAEVERIARASMHDAIRIQVGQRSAPAEGARQQLFEISEERKTLLLVHLLKGDGEGGDPKSRRTSGSGGSPRVLVFLRTKAGVDRLGRVMVARGFNVARIHGDREQSERDHAMAGFRAGKYRILIATDIASRGIDVADIDHVINYDFPHHPEDYVHRIGRTARLAATGLATSFVTHADRRYLAMVRGLIGDKLPAPAPSPLEDALPAETGQHQKPQHEHPPRGHARDSSHERPRQPRGRRRRGRGNGSHGHRGPQTR